MMRCMVIDDEQLVRELLEDNIRQIPFLEWVMSCKNALEAMEALQTNPVDLLFLDIQMPRVNGLQFLQSLSDPPLVILVTAYEQYALEGFNLRVVDYLLKPFGFERFLKACNRAQELFRLRQNDKQAVGGGPQDFFVNVEYALVRVVVADILYIEGVKDYIKIYLSTSARPILTRMTLKAMEEKDCHRRRSFVRINHFWWRRGRSRRSGGISSVSATRRSLSAVRISRISPGY